jgi:hypothetical protein
MPFAGGAERTEEAHSYAGSTGQDLTRKFRTDFDEQLPSLHGSDGMRAGRAGAYLEQRKQRSGDI